MSKEWEIKTRERYISRGKDHYLVLETYVQSGRERIEIESHKIKLPRNLKFITDNDLWHHTDHELKMLHELMDHHETDQVTKEVRDKWHKSLDDLHRIN